MDCVFIFLIVGIRFFILRFDVEIEFLDIVGLFGNFDMFLDIFDEFCSDNFVLL